MSADNRPVKPCHMKIEPDPYALIGLRSNCTDAELASAYRKLVVQLHSDNHEQRAHLRSTAQGGERYIRTRAPAAVGRIQAMQCWSYGLQDCLRTRTLCALCPTNCLRIKAAAPCCYAPHSGRACNRSRHGSGFYHRTTVVAVVTVACWSGRAMIPSRDGGAQ